MDVTGRGDSWRRNPRLQGMRERCCPGSAHSHTSFCYLRPGSLQLSVSQGTSQCPKRKASRERDLWPLAQSPPTLEMMLGKAAAPCGRNSHITRHSGGRTNGCFFISCSYDTPKGWTFGLASVVLPGTLALCTGVSGPSPHSDFLPTHTLAGSGRQLRCWSSWHLHFISM